MNNPWIQTFTGKIVYPFSPDYEQINIVDIAHALSMKCRFNGHCREFYSVAQHCVEVSKLSWNPLLGLLHDAPEAYIGDISAPIKNSLHYIYDSHINTVRDLEWRIWQLICQKYGCFVDDVDDVYDNDIVLLSTEQRDLMGQQTKSWGKLPKPLDKKIIPLSQQNAFALYLIQFDRLTEGKFINEYKGYL